MKERKALLKRIPKSRANTETKKVIFSISEDFKVIFNGEVVFPEDNKGEEE